MERILSKLARLHVLAVTLLTVAPVAVLAEPASQAAPPLAFKLSDVFNRQVRSEDYKGVPLAIICGACWCGGCQQDARPFADLAAKFAPRGVVFIRSVAYDNELTSLEFQKHYRLPFVQLLDPDRAFEKRYNRDGWTFVMAFDRAGKLAYRANKFDDAALTACLEQLTAEPVKVEPIVRDGLPYMRATLERTDELEKTRTADTFPSLAAGPDGRLYLVFTSNRKGNSDIFLRVYDGKSWSEDWPVAATDADEYDASVAVDAQKRAWICWTSNADGKNYNVFVTSLDASGRPGKPTQLTQADDDAMRARMTCDRKGRLWCAYYRWHKLYGFSRDKEVYVRRLDGKEWSPETHVSPEDVPDYEDHTEPAIVPYNDGVLVGWSWDFHRPKNYTQDPESPTIFLRPVGDDFAMEPAVHASGTSVDTTPALAIDGQNRVWCAWDASDWDKRLNLPRKTLRVCRRDLSAARPQPEQRLGPPAVNVCTPNLVVGKNGALSAVWGQNDRGDRWVLRRADREAKSDKWSASSVVQAEGNPRFPSAVFDASGVLWIAYSAETPGGREVKVQAVTPKP